jgi:signal transduction histidine kinase
MMKPTSKLVLVQVLLFLAFLTLILGFYIYSTTQAKLFLKSSKDHFQTTVEQAFLLNHENFFNTLHDNSEWDRTAQYILHPTPAFEKECINTLLQTFSINSIWVFNARGERIYQINDSTDTTLGDLHPDFNVSELLTPEHPNCNFYLKRNGKIYELFGSTVVSTIDLKHTGTPKGFLFFVNVLDSSFFVHLERLTGSGVKLVMDNQSGNRPLHLTGISTIYELKDLRGKTIAQIYFSKHDPFVIEWLKSSRMLLFFNIFLGILLIFIIGYIFRKWVTNPLVDVLGELKKLNAELDFRVRERTAQLEARNRDLNSFTYSISHDLRSPLRAMNGFSRLLLEDYPDKLDSKGKSYLRSISSNAIKMSELIDNLLLFSRVSTTQINRSVIDMNKVVRMIIEEYSKNAEWETIHFILDELPDAYCDGPMIKQVFVNLISNAVKFSGKRHNPEVEIAHTTQNGEVIYYIRDNGVGFDMKYVDKLFGVFQRLHSENEFNGTGIGLAIVKGIIEKHNGRTWAEGKENEGATFYFTLPA